MTTTLQTIFYQAHEFARREMTCQSGREFYKTYRAAFADGLSSIYKSRKYEAECDVKYGVGMRPGFQVHEPRHVWA